MDIEHILNDALNRDTTKLIRNINNWLRKNHRILEELNPDQKRKVSKEKLIEKGFNFNYYTSTYTTKTGVVYFFVYDHGYLPLEDGKYSLVKRNN